jgi:hypothetical protein
VDLGDDPHHEREYLPFDDAHPKQPRGFGVISNADDISNRGAIAGAPIWHDNIYDHLLFQTSLVQSG